MSGQVKGCAIAVIGVLLGLVVGCTTSSSSATGSPEPKGDKGTTITEVHLGDGTRCAVMDKSNGAAIDCEWKQQPVSPSPSAP